MLGDDVPVRVLIADDHPVVRQGLAALFSTQTDLAVVGEATTIAELIRGIATWNPDVVVLDLDLEPDTENEMAALSAIRQHHQNTRVVVYTAHEHEEQVVKSVAIGVEGYILKSANPQELLKAIRMVSRGGLLLQSSVASLLMRHMRCRAATDVAESSCHSSVSRRELDVLRLMGEGRSNQQIADRLSISERTVKFHVSSILSKLEVENRTAAVLKATRTGILEQTVN